MPHRYAKALPVLAPLLGSALLVAFAIASLPPIEALRSRPRTPFDRSAADWVASAYALLRDAGAVIPPGASVVARSEPPDPTRETWYLRLAFSLLPGRKILPPESDGEFLVIVGARPAQPPGDLLLETPEGSVWRRRKG